jgi:triacylglycerol lipase
MLHEFSGGPVTRAAGQGRRSRRSISLRLLTLIAAVATLLVPALAGSASATTNPSPGPFPPGTNSCTATTLHPYPVVLVHGTFENAAQNWASLAPYLQAQGYCVYALNYGNNATGEISVSAGQLATFVDYVLAQTGASKVDLVGHSQGGMMPRRYMQLYGATKVDKLVGLSSSNHGTTQQAAKYAVNCPACNEQYYTSDFIHTVNTPAEVQSGVYYTVVETRYDEVVTPYTSAFLNGSAAQVTNVTLQDKCPNDTDDHVATAYDSVAFQWVDNALSQGAAPADPTFQPVC